ncbi:MAG TPA: ABC transporter substrate-binding protein [Candidatus Binatia bacterium]|jgi:ABC-type nitrate/sulfonate/bicarbonate transport system substrate-binding protein
MKTASERTSMARTMAAMSLTWLILSCQFAIGSFAAERPLRFAYSAVDASFLPAWVAKDARLFDKYNVSLELISVRSSPLCISAHMADEIDVCAGATSPVIAANLQGQRDLVLFGTMNQKAGFWIYAKPAFANLAQLRGKRFGVTRFGGALDFVSRYMLQQAGLDPAKDLTLFQIGATPDIVLALAADSIDAGTLSLPSNLKAKDLGFRELADFTESKQNYPSTALSAKRQFLIENKLRVENFTRALIESFYYIRTHRPEALKILSKYTKVTDPKLLAIAYDFHVEKIWPRTPEINGDDLKLFLEQIGQTNPKALAVDASTLIYTPTVKEVVDSKFAERLYGTGQK